MPTQAIIERVTALAQQGRFARVSSRMKIADQLLLRDGRDAYYSADEWPDGTHLLKDHRNGVGDLRLPRAGRCAYLHATTVYAGGADIGNGDAVTIAFRFKSTESGTAHIVSKGGAGDYQWGVRVAAGVRVEALQHRSGGPAVRVAQLSGVDFSDWTDVVVVLTADRGRIWASGSETENSDALTDTWHTAGGTFRIGKRLEFDDAADAHIRDVVIAEADLWEHRSDILNNPNGYGAVAFYPMEEEAGYAAFDATDNGNHLTWTNITESTFHAEDASAPTSWANGDGFTGFRYFNGTTSHRAVVETVDHGGLTEFTVAGWVVLSRAGGSYEALVASTDASGSPPFLFRVTSDSKLDIYLRAGANYNHTGSDVLDRGVLYHVAASWDGEDLRLWVNGVRDNGTKGATGTMGAATKFSFGAWESSAGNWSSTFRGMLNDWSIYHEALTDEQVADLAARETPTGAPAAAGEWELFFNGSDASGNENDVAFTGTSQAIIPRVRGTELDALGAPCQSTGGAPNAGLYLPPAATGDGASVAVDCGEPLIPATDDFEVEVWYYHSAGSAQALFVQYDGDVTPDGFYVAATSGNELRLNPSSLGAAHSITDVILESGEWHHVRLARSGGSLSLTLTNTNGQQGSVASDIGAGSIAQLNTELLVRDADLYSSGCIGGMRVTTGGVTKHVVFDGVTRTAWVLGDDGSVAAGEIVNGDLATIFAERGPGLWRDPGMEFGGKFAFENLFARSEEFEDSAWLKNRLTVTADDAAAPDGSVTAEKLTPTTVWDNHDAWQYVEVEEGVAYTISVHVKAAGYDVVSFLFDSAAAGFPGADAVFDLAAESVLRDTTSGGAAIEAVGDGWYRISATETAEEDSTLARIKIRIWKGNTLAFDDHAYEGDGTSGIHAWGAQISATDSAIPYSKTTDSGGPDRLVPIALDGSAYADGEAVDEESAAHIPAGKFADPAAAIDRTGGVPQSVFAHHASAPTEELTGDDVKTNTESRCRKRTVGVYADRLGSSVDPLTSATANAYFGD